AEPAPRKRGRPKKVVSVVDLLPRRNEMVEPWLRMSEEAFDTPPVPIPEVALPRAIPADPSVFIQLGPLPHARIEASLCLAALMHRTAQVVQIQIEEGVGNMEEPEAQPEAAAEPAASPFESAMPAQPSAKPWRHSKKRRWGKG
ncbi:MAG: hypothetical protein HGA66_08685, partial [Holophaga sp.]|nr:hypothetical protein [Holophaga sp.]